MKYKKFNKMKWNEFFKTRHFLVDVTVHRLFGPLDLATLSFESVTLSVSSVFVGHGSIVFPPLLGGVWSRHNLRIRPTCSKEGALHII